MFPRDTLSRVSEMELAKYHHPSDWSPCHSN
jgi:V/A-type H+-transporting ATPase subunit B